MECMLLCPEDTLSPGSKRGGATGWAATAREVIRIHLDAASHRAQALVELFCHHIIWLLFASDNKHDYVGELSVHRHLVFRKGHGVLKRPVYVESA
eukprot:XP_001708763.1 Hypothetical protein GL50803_89549 [Giardia lamblia ATCC 50803]